MPPPSLPLVPLLSSRAQSAEGLSPFPLPRCRSSGALDTFFSRQGSRFVPDCSVTAPGLERGPGGRTAAAALVAAAAAAWVAAAVWVAAAAVVAAAAAAAASATAASNRCANWQRVYSDQ